MKSLTKQNFNTIISMQTMPPQIDYITPKQKSDYNKAELYLEKLSKEERDEAWKYINDQVESHYSPTIKGQDGNFYSVADLEEMF